MTANNEHPNQGKDNPAQRNGLPIVVFDTSTLVADPDALSAYPHVNLVLPLRVVEELDGLKKRDDEVGWLARRAIRTIEQIRVTAGGSLAHPVELPNGSTLQVVLNGVAKGLLTEFGLDPDLSDNRIIGSALGLNNTADVPVCVVSNDAAFRIKAAHLGLSAVEHQIVHRRAGPGFTTVQPQGAEIDQLYEGTLGSEQFDLAENEYVVLQAGSQSGLGRRRGDRIVKLDNSVHPWGAKGRNVEQRMALDLLLDPNVPIVALDGPAGTGKSLLAIAAGLEQTVEQRLYHRISIFRSLVAVGREEVGFLPGDLAQKTQPHFAAVHDTVCALSADKDPQTAEKIVEGLLFTNKLTLEPVSFLRGRSLAMTYIVVDEAQNLEIAVLKTLLTRVAAGTKIVFLGDTSQIDNPFTSQSNNALTALIDAFSGQPMFGHIRLSICERSEVAALAAELL